MAAAVPDPPPVVPSPGGFFSNDSFVARAQKVNAALYSDLSSRPCTDPLTEFPKTFLGNHIYCISSGAHLSGPLTFEGTSNVSGPLRWAPEEMQ